MIRMKESLIWLFSWQKWINELKAHKTQFLSDEKTVIIRTKPSKSIFCFIARFRFGLTKKRTEERPGCKLIVIRIREIEPYLWNARGSPQKCCQREKARSLDYLSEDKLYNYRYINIWYERVFLNTLKHGFNDI